MSRLSKFLTRFILEESAQDVIEYALMLVLVALVTAGTVPNISSAISNIFSTALSDLA